jgi:hypothetical protein
VKLPSYAKIYALGHSAIAELFFDEVVVQEKVDGSQFSFGVVDGELHARSKGAVVNVDAPDGMFAKAVETITKLSGLPEGVVFRGEYLQRPKHNTLAYDRVPRGHIVLFDVSRAGEHYTQPDGVREWGERLGLEAVPTFRVAKLSSFTDVEHLMENVSMLGGQKVEGLVFKNYHRFGIDGRVLMGKHVSERFKEVHRDDWRQRQLAGGDIKQELCHMYRTEARWDKAVQHLRDRGELTGTPKDIGALLKEVQLDIEAECADEIKDRLWKWIRKDVLRSSGFGLPEWYKQRLAVGQFGDESK